MLTSLVWRLGYSRWKTAPATRKEGYTLLVMVPGDMPVFLDLALDVCSRQNLEHLVEVLVIPDMPSPAFTQHFEASVAARPQLPMRLITLDAFDRWTIKQLDNPHHNHWMQLTAGINACQTTHALMHDADLFIEETDFLKTHYEEALRREVDCMGVSEVWDPWFRENGYAHVTATWELLFRTDWARQFPPYLHRGHTDTIDGKLHDFDTLLVAQCQTPANKIARHERPWGFVHFNYVICTYRWFQQGKAVFEDENFRLLLIRLLIDACDRSGWTYAIPSLDELQQAVKHQAGRVTYRAEKTAAAYPEFRDKLEQLLTGPVLSESQRSLISAGIAPFDKAFNWSPAAV